MLLYVTLCLYAHIFRYIPFESRQVLTPNLNMQSTSVLSFLKSYFYFPTYKYSACSSYPKLILTIKLPSRIKIYLLFLYLVHLKQSWLRNYSI